MAVHPDNKLKIRSSTVSDSSPQGFRGGALKLHLFDEMLVVFRVMGTRGPLRPLTWLA